MWTLLSVLLLSGVIYGGAALSDPGKLDLPAERVGLGDDEYRSARAALAEGDFENAEALALKAIEADPDHTAAKSLLAQVRRDRPAANKAPASNSGAPDADTGDPEDKTPPEDPEKPNVDDGYTQPLDSLGALLPREIDGYVRGSVEDGKTSAILSLRPAAAQPVSSAVLSVIDQGSVDAARAYVATVNKEAYTGNAAAVTIGQMAGRFGTDDLGHATAVFSRGRFVFETVVTTGADPASVKTTVLQLASRFPSASL